jgi:hypothetical protein
MLSSLNKGFKRQSFARNPSPLDHGLGFTIRHAYPDDAVPLRRLAAFDSQRPLEGRIIVAEVDGEIWAAIGLEAEPQMTAEPRVIADPFRLTATLVAVLEQHAAAGVPAPRAHIPARGAGRPAAVTVH